MAARSRPRAGQVKEEVDEERSIWNQLRSDAKRVDALVVRTNFYSIWRNTSSPGGFISAALGVSAAFFPRLSLQTTNTLSRRSRTI